MAEGSSPFLDGDSTPSAAWLHSIDAVYTLFEHEPTAKKYANLAPKVREAVRLCEEVIRDVGWEHCALSFNGGKDCTVLVHILSAVLRRVSGATSPPLPAVPSLYITCPSPFPTVEKFIHYCISPRHGYNLHVISVSGGMKEGIKTYLDGGGKEQVGIHQTEDTEEPSSQSKRQVTAMFVGTRRDDPHGPSLEPRSWTDKDWPRVERIHPILEWTYSDVWQFLRCPHLASTDESLGMSRQQLASQCGTAGGGSQGVPYCLLYEQGYTSLGSTFNTLPNPQLKLASEDNPNATTSQAVVVGDGNAKGLWRPAYMLQDGSQERAGRISQSSPPPSSPLTSPHTK